LPGHYCRFFAIIYLRRLRHYFDVFFFSLITLSPRRFDRAADIIFAISFQIYADRKDTSATLPTPRFRCRQPFRRAFLSPIASATFAFRCHIIAAMPPPLPPLAMPIFSRHYFRYEFHFHLRR
jgi:hypothetical protein